MGANGQEMDYNMDTQMLAKGPVLIMANEIVQLRIRHGFTLCRSKLEQQLLSTGWIKVNTNGAVNITTEMAIVGDLIRDEKGERLLGFNRHNPSRIMVHLCCLDKGVEEDNRRFVSDSSDSSHSHLSSPQLFSLCAGTLLPGLPPIYNTARVFKAPSKYVFDVKDPGTHMLRLHFHRFSSPQLNLADSKFHVLVNGLVALTNFSGGGSVGPKVIEYLLWFNSEKVEITFLPAEKSKFAFVSAIEVISAPKDLILETAQSVNGDKVENLKKQAFEVMYRVTIGGPKVTPFNDSLWRTWLPDDDYFKSKEGSNRVYFSGRIKYQEGGASREVGPDNVYNSARLIESKNASIPNVNLSWEFPIWILRPLPIICWLLRFFVDLVVDADHSGIVNVTVGPSNKSMAYAVDAILNGVEIMKISNWMGSFDGTLPAESVLKCLPRKRRVGFLLPLIALVCLLLSLSAIIRTRNEKVESVLWSKLPMEVHEISPKQGKQQLSSKV
ncbi:hypothetical protein GOBAR_AA04981 [Gossypium barbadense]|uniref:Malectin-like domain-containing protein n=1 Tax=Gossypium barbadense TaxID=3634 RepID=A0A2P5YJ23_GOSBA|nr:hypothetical protein GOBAR_AA04981 [Gossypium barbadense]